MYVIETSELAKRFIVKKKAAGLAGSLKSMLRPVRHEVEAVRGVSLTVRKGEIVGLIGPNGAGKSTTIKMLTGILHPTSGTAQVCGFVPWKDRRRLAYRIGTVFGQRPQLLFHLPAADSFQLFGKLYGMDDARIARRVADLAAALDLGGILDVPLRKLSLGQRMRCEVAGSLLHSPEILLLDEPSIGLDIVSRQALRDTVRQMSEKEGVTVILTSHDVGDIESLCRRVVIVNHGEVVFDDGLEALRRRHLSERLAHVTFEEPVTGDLQESGVETVGTDRYELKVRFDQEKITTGAVLAAMAKKGRIRDVNIASIDMEQVIGRIFQEGRKERPA